MFFFVKFFAYYELYFYTKCYELVSFDNVQKKKKIKETFLL